MVLSDSPCIFFIHILFDLYFGTDGVLRPNPVTHARNCRKNATPRLFNKQTEYDKVVVVAFIKSELLDHITIMSTAYIHTQKVACV